MTRRLGVVILLVVGLAAMAADLAGLTLVRGVAGATGASPAPRVFSAVRGLETFSTRFVLEWRDARGVPQTRVLTPEVYARVRGPYNRRNVYGALLAYAPVLATDPHTQAMFEDATRFALCGEAPLLREIGIDPADVDGTVTVRLVPERADRLPDDLPLTFTTVCP